jgi:hypothetical protein
VILSVDFDGVFHSCHAADDVRSLDVVTPAQLHAAGLFEHAGLVAELLEPLHEVQLVVHSAWRLTSSVERLRELLGPLGPRVVGTTHKALDRELSILEWLHQHGQDERDVIVLDDEPQLFAHLLPRVVACDPVLGVSAPAVLQGLRDRLPSGGTSTPKTEPGHAPGSRRT